MVRERFQYLHFTLRGTLNQPLPRSLSECRGWRLVPTAAARYHQNGTGAPEIKLVANDGREVIFDGDTLQPIDLASIGGSYNYCPTLPWPGWMRLNQLPEFLCAGLMHFALDVLPFWIERHSKTHFRLQNESSDLINITMNSEIAKIRTQTEKQLDDVRSKIELMTKRERELTEVLEALPAGPAQPKPAATAKSANK